MLRSQTIKIALGLAVFGLAIAVKPAFASAATLSVSPASGSVAVGETIEVKILLDTAGAASNGVDAKLNFDPSVFQVVDAAPGTSGTQILAGSLFSNTTLNTADNGAGTISFSQANSGGTNYTGSGTLATITFSAVKAASASAVTFKYQSGSTTDSNVSKSDNTDLLGGVTNGSYTVTAAGSSSTPTPSTDGSDGSSDGSGSNTSGKGGTSTVAGTGMDLNGFMILTIASLIGAGYFFTRKQPRHR